MTPGSQNRRRTDPVRVLLAAEHRLSAEALAPDDEIEVACGVSSRAQDLAAVMALIPGVRVVMLSSSPAVEDVERARDAGAMGHGCKDAEGGTVAGDMSRRRPSTRVPPTHPWAA